MGGGRSHTIATNSATADGASRSRMNAQGNPLGSLLLGDRHDLCAAILGFVHQNLLFHHSRKFYLRTPLSFFGGASQQNTIELSQYLNISIKNPT